MQERREAYEVLSLRVAKSLPLPNVVSAARSFMCGAASQSEGPPEGVEYIGEDGVRAIKSMNKLLLNYYCEAS